MAKYPKAKLAQSPTKGNINKILFVGYFQRPYDTEVYIANSLRELGVDVTCVQITELDACKYLSLANSGRFDLLLTGKGWIQGTSTDYLDAYKKVAIPKVCWFFDLVLGIRRQFLVNTWPPLLFSDITFTTDGGHQEEYERRGINHRCLRQGIYQDEAVLGTKTKAEDVVFIGTSVHREEFGWTHREKLLAFLEKTYGDRFKWYGKNDGVRGMDLNNLLASAKVVVGDSVHSPNYWSNRLYEVTGRGGFLIFPKIEGIEKEFTPYKDFIPYSYYDFEGLKQKIDYYVSHDEERERIRLSGFEHCKKNHTYLARCKELLKQIRSYDFTRPSA